MRKNLFKKKRSFRLLVKGIIKQIQSGPCKRTAFKRTVLIDMPNMILNMLQDS